VSQRRAQPAHRWAHQPAHPSSHRCGLTLAELLAVLFILTIAASVGVAAVGGLRGTHSARATEHSIRAGLERVRLLAERSGGCILAIDAGGLTARPDRSLTTAPDRSLAADLAIAIPLPSGWQILDPARTGPQLDGRTIRFDAAGRSQDFALHLGSTRGDRLSLFILGIGGQTQHRAPGTLTEEPPR
jgi:prepilin-type N-terminal cleavage/methylation domain-containing protein